MEPATVLALYRPRPGQEAELHRLVLQHAPLLRRSGLLADAPTVLLRTAAGTFVEILRWRSAALVQQARDQRKVRQLWDDIGRVSDAPAIDAGTESATEAPSFVPVSMASRSPDASAAGPKLGIAAYVLAALSFIPLAGIPLALIAIIWGLTTKKRGGGRLLGLGLGGVGVSIIALFAVFFFKGMLFPGPQFDMMTRMNLPSAVQSVEFHRLQTGHYPATLADLRETQPPELFIHLVDPGQAWRQAGGGLLYYERIDADHYYLLSVGRDGEPFTDDDILPQIDIKPGSRVGLVIKRG